MCPWVSQAQNIAAVIRFTKWASEQAPTNASTSGESIRVYSKQYNITHLIFMFACSHTNRIELNWDAMPLLHPKDWQAIRVW